MFKKIVCVALAVATMNFGFTPANAASLNKTSREVLTDMTSDEKATMVASITVHAAFCGMSQPQKTEAVYNFLNKQVSDEDRRAASAPMWKALKLDKDEWCDRISMTHKAMNKLFQ